MKRGRKGKYKIYNNKVIVPNWNAGVYIRLSAEDRNDKAESNSITNQRELLNDFLQYDTDIQVYDYYVDDGYSGTNSNRPNFQRLLNDMKDEKINVIIVKDLSRLGRNFVEVGNYIEQIFPIFNIRFISVSDNIDSYLKPDSIKNLNVALKSLMNEEYSRDLSKKIRSAFETKRKNGEFIGSIAPYGYVKDKQKLNHLVINPEPANIVKQIFNWAKDGKSAKAIAKMLNQQKIINPTGYKRKVQKIKCGHILKEDTKEEIKYTWEMSSITQILTNQIYCGDMIQGKSTNESYKNHKKIYKPKEEWTIVENTHKAIIDRATFDEVQEILESRKRQKTENRKGTKSIFAGHLRCADCKMAMLKGTYVYKEKPKKNYYHCSTHANRSDILCTKHYIKEETLRETVLETIRFQVKLSIEIDNTIKEIRKIKFSNGEKENIQKQIDIAEREILKQKVLKRSVYEDWKLGNVTEKDYQKYIQSYNNKVIEKTELLKNLKEQIKEITEKTANNDWIENFKKYQKIKGLTPEIIDSLIDTIYVHEDNKITIQFRYENEYKKAIDFIKENQNKTNKKLLCANI